MTQLGKQTYKNNMKFLENNLPTIYNKIKKVKRNSLDYRVNIASKEGLPFVEKKLIERWQPLISKYAPQKEAIQLVEGLKLEPSGTGVILIGLGFGYLGEEIINQHPNIKLYIIEPDIQVFLNTLEYRDWSSFPWDKTERFIIGNESIDYQEFISAFIDKITPDWQMVMQPSYIIAYPKFMDKFTECLSEYRRNYSQAADTSIVYERVWRVNALFNLPFVENTPSYKSLQPVLINKPIILVGAGPSLDESIDFLKKVKLQQSAYIMAVGSGLKALINNGIEPDAFFTHDPTITNYDNLKDVLKENIPMFFASSTAYQITREHIGAKFNFITYRDTIYPFYSQKKVDYIIDAGTVANVALNILLKLQVGVIFLVGIDLGFRGTKRYSEGTDHVFQEQLDDSALGKDYFLVESNNGGMVYTDKGFERMRSELSGTLKNNKICPVYNLSSFGAKINGAFYISFEEAEGILDKYEIKVSPLPLKGGYANCFSQLQDFYTKLEIDLSNYRMKLVEIENKVQKMIIGDSLRSTYLTEFLTLCKSETYQKVIAPMVESRVHKFNRYFYNFKDSLESPSFINEFLVLLQELIYIIKFTQECIEYIQEEMHVINC